MFATVLYFTVDNPSLLPACAYFTAKQIQLESYLTPVLTALSRGCSCYYVQVIYKLFRSKVRYFNSIYSRIVSIIMSTIYSTVVSTANGRLMLL